MDNNFKVMKVKSETKLTYKNKKAAKIIYDTLEVDNDNFVESKIDGAIITYTTDNSSLSTTLATIDDLIVCELLSEKITMINDEQP